MAKKTRKNVWGWVCVAVVVVALPIGAISCLPSVSPEVKAHQEAAAAELDEAVVSMLEAKANLAAVVSMCLEVQRKIDAGTISLADGEALLKGLKVQADGLEIVVKETLVNWYEAKDEARKANKAAEEAGDSKLAIAIGWVSAILGGIVRSQIQHKWLEK